jgi:hypothetical protein
MNYSNKFDTNAEPHATRMDTETGVVLAREAGIPFQLTVSPLSDADPFTEWLSLMEVVQMLCPVWPVRDRPMQGHHWLL